MATGPDAPAPQDARSARLKANFWWIFAVIGVSSFLGPLSGSITNVALPSIAEGFDVDVQSVKWVVLAYLMVSTFLLPIVGKLGQKFGEGRIFTMGFAVYCVGSVACAMATHGGLGLLIAARMVQASGSALLFGVGSALATRYIPPERRGLAFGLIGSIVGIALVAGPVLGGIIAGALGWPWIFWLLVPVTVLGLGASLVLLPPDEIAGADIPALSSVLWVLLVVGATLVAEAFSKGLLVQYLPLTGALTVALLAAFILSERRGQPLFDYSLFTIPVFRVGALAGVLVNLVIFPLILFLPFYLENYRGLTPTRVGLLLAISPIISILIGPGSGHLADRTGYRRPIIGGLAIMTAGFVAMALALQRGSIPGIGVGLGLMGFGSALFGGPNYAALMGSVDPPRRALASSFGSLTRNLGFLVGTSLSAVGFGLLLWRFGGRELMVAARTAELNEVVPLPAFVYAFNGLLLGCAALCLAAMVVSLRFPDRPVQH